MPVPIFAGELGGASWITRIAGVARWVAGAGDGGGGVSEFGVNGLGTDKRIVRLDIRLSVNYPLTAKLQKEQVYG